MVPDNNFFRTPVSADPRAASKEMQKYIVKTGMKSKIFALVHDSVLAEVPLDEVELYSAKLKEFIQRDRGLSVPGTPIGCDFDVADDYSLGKFEKLYDLS